MDAFFASVEQRDFARLRGKPVVVGGQPDSRGVVAACSYEARQFGVHSAMPSAHAYRLCPEAIFVKPRFEVYKEVSTSVHQIFSEFTDIIEPLSLDEAYLDVTESADFPGVRDIPLFDGSATGVANHIRKKIAGELRLTASAGVSYNKFLAKIASDINKPNGFYVVRPEDARAFIAKLPIAKINGVGKVTEGKLKSMGVQFGGDLRGLSLETLTNTFGKSGERFFDLARGKDERPVKGNRVRKSLGVERTFSNDLVDRVSVKSRINELAEKISTSLHRRNQRARTFTLKIKYADFVQITRSRTLAQYADKIRGDGELIDELLEKTEVGQKPVRLLGLTASGFEGDQESTSRAVSSRSQLTLF